MRSRKLMVTRAVAVAVAFPLACARSTVPTPPAVQLNGTWTGRYVESSCSSVCQPCCSERFKSGPPMRDFTLNVFQQGSQLTGEFAERPRQSSAALKGPVSGKVTGTRVRLTGSFSWDSDVFPDVFGSADLRGAVWSADAAGGPITGSFVLVDRDADGSEVRQRSCDIVRLERVSP